MVDTVVKTEKFGGNFQDWKFWMEMAVKWSCVKLHTSMECLRDQVVYVAPCEKVTEENRGYNANLYYFLSQRTEWSRT